jgi:acetyltransferase-like isoleucine patch superfamily enzyme
MSDRAPTALGARMSAVAPVIDAVISDIAPSASVGEGSVIRAGELTLGPGARIGDNVRIEADTVVLGHDATISDDCRLMGIGAPAEHLEMGDRFFLGPSSTVLLPQFVAGDYVAIHNHLLLNGYKPCVIGHNTWIGQNCVLNSTDDLTIGNNVGIGAYSSLYTHAYNGELLEGCEIWSTAPVVIEDNAWLVGSYNVISPGVTVGARGMVLTSSVVSRDVPPAHCVGGVPAKDLTDRVRPFRDVTLGEKIVMMRRFVDEFVGELHAADSQAIDGGHLVRPAGREPFFVVVQDRLDPTALPEGAGAVYAGAVDRAQVDERVTVFDVSTKRYGKRRSAIEVALIRFMNGYRARFVPDDRPRVTTLPR